MGARRTPLAGRLWLALASALVLVFSAYALRHFGGGAGREVVGRWVNAAAGVMPGLYCIGRAVARRRERLAWFLLGLGSTAWGIGGVYYLTAYWGASSVPYPSVADIGYLAVYPFGYAGLLLLLKNRLTGFRNTLWLDGLIGALAVSAFATAVVFEKVQSNVGGSSAAVATNLAYPLGDALLIALIVLVCGMSGWRPGRAWLLLGLGFLFFFAGDSVYLVQTAQGTYSPGHLVDACWPAGLLLVAFAAAKPSPARRAVRADGWIVLAAPAVFIGAVIGLEMWDHYHPVNTLALVLMTLALLVGVARLALTFAENLDMLRRSRTEALTDPLTHLANRRRLVDDLEAAVHEPGRTRLLVLFDLNGFKQYNDTFGHPAGDELLRRLGARLAAAAGDRGRAYRMGGDEFCILVEQRGIAASGLLERAVEALTEQGDRFSVSPALGHVELPADADEAVTALRLADQRMYANKASTRLSARQQSSNALLAALINHAPSLDRHVANVVELSVAVGRRLALKPEQLDDLRVAATLHDLGKVAIPTAILDKEGPLDEAEWAFLRKHTLIAETIMQAAPSLAAAARIVRSSHERVDGTGYPDGLAGDEIPFESRVIFACDAYDAMLGSRPYARGRSTEEALARLRAAAGTQFDPAVVDAICAEIVARRRLAAAA